MSSRLGNRKTLSKQTQQFNTFYSNEQDTESNRNSAAMADYSSQGISQPSLDQAYETAGNPTDKEPVEKSRAQLNAQTDKDNAV